MRHSSSATTPAPVGPPEYEGAGERRCVVDPMSIVSPELSRTSRAASAGDEVVDATRAHTVKSRNRSSTATSVYHGNVYTTIDGSTVRST